MDDKNDALLPGDLVKLITNVFVVPFKEPRHDNSNEQRELTMLEAVDASIVFHTNEGTFDPFGQSVGMFISIEYIKQFKPIKGKSSLRRASSIVELIDIPYAKVMFGQHAAYVSMLLLKKVKTTDRS